MNYTENFVEKNSLIKACFLRCSLTSCRFSVIVANYWKKKKQNAVTGLASAMQQETISEDFPLH